MATMRRWTIIGIAGLSRVLWLRAHTTKITWSRDL
jgi:hypothetical protein